MAELMTGIVGLLGVLVGALLTSLLERWNWQRQEAMKAYAEFFTIGGEAFRTLNGLAVLLGNLVGAAGNRPLADAAKEDADIARGYGQYAQAYSAFGQNEDRTFRNQTSLCWMLERDPAIRTRIEEIEGQYDRCKLRLHLMHDELGNRHKGALEAQIRNLPHPDSLGPLMDNLRLSVAAKYFHGGESPKPTKEQSDAA